MSKAAFILAAAGSALGLATLAVAQESADEQYLAVTGGTGPWYLQRSTCTLAHNDDAGEVTVWFRIGMGTAIEFADGRLRDVPDGPVAGLAVVVDGAVQEAEGGLGSAFEDGRQGYHLFGAPELIDRIAAGQRLDVKSGGQALLQLPLAGAGPAVAALRACLDRTAETVTNAM